MSTSQWSGVVSSKTSEYHPGDIIRIVVEEQFAMKNEYDLHAVRRKTLNRERKRLGKVQRMRGYARQSIAIIAPRTGVKKGTTK